MSEGEVGNVMMARLRHMISSFQVGALFGIAISALVLTVAFWSQAEYQTMPDEFGHWWRWTVSAESSGLYTLGLIIVGGFQAVLFVWQLSLIRKSLIDTKKAARAAKRQAKLARDSLIASQRAWIQIGNIRSEGDLACHSNGMSLQIGLNVTNVGNTPAIDVRLKVWIGMFGPGGYDGTQFPKLCEEKRLDNSGFFTSIFFPKSKDSEYIYLKEIAMAKIEACNEGATLLNTGENVWNPLLMGCVDYTFPSDRGKRHQTRFVYRIYSDTEIIAQEFLRGDSRRYRIVGLSPFEIFENFSAD